MTKTLRSVFSYIALAIIVLVAVVTTQVVTAQVPTTTTDVMPTVLHSFIRSKSDGGSPHAGLVQGSDGNLYGTTTNGGEYDKGIIFRIAPDGSNFAILFSFNGNDGQEPDTTLVEGDDKKSFYGTTFHGGGSGYDGTVFKFTLGGTLTTIHAFGKNNDGVHPTGVIRGNDGNFYGTTNGSFGTFYRITANGAFDTLHQFENTTDSGIIPQGKLFQGNDGNLYGTTGGGGKYGNGTLYRIAPIGGKPYLLYSFSTVYDRSNGCSPSAGVIQDAAGDLYGTTYSCGPGSSNNGTIFKYSLKDGTLKTLHSFNGSDGTYLVTSLLLASNGKLYGTAQRGGSKPLTPGVVYRISTDGTDFTVLHNFSVGDSGPSTPESELIEGQDGSLYGTSNSGGGPYNDGTVYKLSLGLVSSGDTVSKLSFI